MSKVRKSVKSLFVGNLISKAIGFIGTIVLARILFPEDYGYLVMATIFTAFTQMIGGMGFEIFYLQEKIIDEEHEKKILNVTFKLRMLVNICLFLIQFIGSYFVEEYLEKEIVGQLLRIYAFDYLILGAIVVNLYILRKKLEYLPEVYGNMSRDITGTASRILFASLGFGALSFAYGNIIGNTIRLFVILKYQRFKPDLFDWDKKIFEKVYFFGKHSFFGGVAMYLSDYIDRILLAKYFPANVIGFYSFGNAQGQVMSSYLVGPQGSLITSYIANNKENPAKLMDLLSKVSYFIGLILLPISFVFYFYSELIFHVVFGVKWDGSIVLFELFLWYAFAKALLFPISSVLTAYGYPQVASKIMIVKLFVLAGALFITVNFTDEILIYAGVFIVVSFLFDVLKSGIGLYLIKENIFYYLGQLRNLSVVAMGYTSVYFMMSVLNFNDVKGFYVYIVLIILSSILFHFFIFSKKFLVVVEMFFGNNNKITRYLKDKNES